MKAPRRVLPVLAALLLAMPLGIVRGEGGTQMQLPRSESVPGGVRIIALPGPADAAPVAMFGQHRVMVLRANDTWLAVVGIGLAAPVGEAKLSVEPTSS